MVGPLIHIHNPSVSLSKTPYQCSKCSSLLTQSSSDLKQKPAPSRIQANTIPPYSRGSQHQPWNSIQTTSTTLWAASPRTSLAASAERRNPLLRLLPSRPPHPYPQTPRQDNPSRLSPHEYYFTRSIPALGTVHNLQTLNPPNVLPSRFIDRCATIWKTTLTPCSTENTRNGSLLLSSISSLTKHFQERPHARATQ